MPVKEIEEYRQFTKPAELHKAINTLRGIVAGITADLSASNSEMQELVHWCSLHEHLRNRHPFNELLPLIEDALEDGALTEDEGRDILWLCNNFVHDSQYYNFTTSSMQFLSGLLHGIMADGVIEDTEIQALRLWIESNDHLQGCYPFDEINSILTSILADGRIDDEERTLLTAFFSEFIDLSASYNLNEIVLTDLREQCKIGGVCALCPEITFEDKTFCFTGQSRFATRAEFAAYITDLGGNFRGSVSKATDYLIVGNAGNPCWAYACYGRKIEDAIALRKQGAKVMIVNETDFWDAIKDLDLDFETSD